MEPTIRLSLLTLALTACHGPVPVDSAGVGSVDAIVEVDPVELAFFDVLPGDSATAQVTIRSIGTDTVLLQAIEALLSDAFTVQGAPGVSVMPPGTEVVVDVTYTPTGTEHEGWLAVRTDAPEQREVLVDLWGGIRPPELVVDPIELDFGNALPGETVTLPITLSNPGGVPVELHQVRYLPGLEPAVWTEAAFDFATLEPGAEQTFEMSFHPTSLVPWAYEGTIEFVHSAGDPVEVPYHATSQNTPIAVCEASPDIIHAWVDTANFVGDASYNPEDGDIIAWEWTLLSRPTGSAQDLPGPLDQPTITGFRPDLAGEYVAQLVVTNEDGVQSAPCEATLLATVGDDLWIELFWSVDDDDMDLHLVREGGNLFSQDDCHWDNCQYSSLQWGANGNTSDDPSLDFDDIFGTGPENINIARPADGTYEVWVHDFETSEFYGANAVTVNVYVFGQLEYSETHPVTGEGTRTHFADVSFPGGIVTPQ